MESFHCHMHNESTVAATCVELHSIHRHQPHRSQSDSPPRSIETLRGGEEHDGRGGGGAAEDRLLRRGRVGAGDGALGRGARAGDGRAGHLRLLRRALPGARPAAARRALRRRRPPALRAARRRQAPQPLRAGKAIPRLPRWPPGPPRVREPRHCRRARAGRRPGLRRPHVSRRRQRRLLRDRPRRGGADGGAGGGGAADGHGGARGGRRRGPDPERALLALVPDVRVRGADHRREGKGGAVRVAPGHQLAERRVPARGRRAGDAGQGRPVDPRPAVAGVARRHGRQRSPGVVQRPCARAVPPDKRGRGRDEVLGHPLLRPRRADDPGARRAGGRGRRPPSPLQGLRLRRVRSLLRLRGGCSPRRQAQGLLRSVGSSAPPSSPAQVHH